MLEYLQWGAILFLAGGLAGTWWAFTRFGKEGEKTLDALIDMIESDSNRNKAHTKAFETLSDADKIVEEMERSANVTEMRIARRTTLPREDAGPPAKVYRPKIHKRYPRSWPK